MDKRNPTMPKPATAATIEAQRKFRASLPREDGRDERWARQGFIATLADPVSRRTDGSVVYDPDATRFLDTEEVPPTVNPALWRHQRLMRIHGLFEVTKNVWQVRSISATNVTIVRGKTGWIVIDPDLNTETAASIMKLVHEHLGKRPISAFIVSHSHIDHIGGIVGALGEQTEIPVIVAPEFFLEEMTSEWVMAGNAMTRRSCFQWSVDLPRNPTGFVGTGLSSDVPLGTVRFMAPTDIVKCTGETRVLDGVSFEFQMIPDTEAVAEFNVYLPDERVFYIAEYATATMHNLQTPRGAKARDAKRWAGFLTESSDRYGTRSDAVIFGHTWPRFGSDEICRYIDLQRDMYKFIHDQTVRMANLGLTPHEIAQELKPPKGISDEWSTHGYYGSYKHNARGVYQYYIGWWDGIPAHFDPLPPVEQARRYVEAIGAERILPLAREAFDKGDYRWVAELLNHLVFAEPGNREAKELLADACEQLGYQAESSNARGIYLVGAAELRGKPPFKDWLGSPDLVMATTTAAFMDLLATRLDPAKVDGKTMTFQLEIVDRGETVLLTVINSVLVARIGATVVRPDARVTATHPLLVAFFLQRAPLDRMHAGGMAVEGNADLLLALQDAIENPPIDFAVVTP